MWLRTAAYIGSLSLDRTAGFSGRHFILVKNTAEKALWFDGRRREESFEGQLVPYSLPCFFKEKEKKLDLVRTSCFPMLGSPILPTLCFLTM